MDEPMKQNPTVILNTLGSFAYDTNTLGDPIRRGRKKLDQKPSSTSKRKSVSQEYLKGQPRKKKKNLNIKSEKDLTDDDDDDDDAGSVEIVDINYNKAAIKEIIKQEKEDLDALILSKVSEKVNEGFKNQLVQIESLFSNFLQEQKKGIISAVTISGNKEIETEKVETPISIKKGFNISDVAILGQPENKSEKEKSPISGQSSDQKSKVQTPHSAIKKEKVNTPTTAKSQISKQLSILEHTPKSDIIKENEESGSEGEFAL